ncbi:MAG: hypothetical protein RIT25_988 [Planctomycetota bacterium]
MDLWTVLGVWCVASCCLAPVVGRFLRGTGPADFAAKARPARDEALRTSPSSDPRRYWQSAG